MTVPNSDMVFRAPQDVGTDPAGRVEFLHELAADPEYVALLRRVSEKVCDTKTTLNGGVLIVTHS